LSAIPCVRERIAELAVDNAFVLIKLHTMVDRKWQIFYEKLARQAHGLVIIMEDDFAQAMACAQVLVSDVSSVFVEFMLLDKPIVLFNSPLQNSYQYYDANDIEYKLRDAALQVNTAEELKLAVKLSLADPGALSHIRAKYAGQLGCPQDGKCVQRAALAVMDLAGKLPAIPAEGPLFSIIIEGDCAPDTGEIKETIAEIESTSQGLRYEIIVGAGSVQSGLQYGGKVISAPLSRNALTTDVLNYASGDYLVWLKHDVMLPDNFLKWMWHFFRWHKGTGAVKALSYLDNFIDIINKIPDQHKPRSFDDASQYFMHALMGNECALTCVDDHVDCLMISRDAFQSAFDHTPPVAKYDGLHNMCLQLTLNKLSIWQALNVFVYPRSLHSELLSCKESHPTVTAQEAAAGDCLQYVQGLLTEALACRAEKKYKKAVEILEKAKARIAGDKE